MTPKQNKKVNKKVLEPIEPKKKLIPTAVKNQKSQLSSLPLTHENIALRAYFLSQSRRSLGVAGDAEGDWLEAERQLSEESLQKNKD